MAAIHLLNYQRKSNLVEFYICIKDDVVYTESEGKSIAYMLSKYDLLFVSIGAVIYKMMTLVQNLSNYASFYVVLKNIF